MLSIHVAGFSDWLREAEALIGASVPPEEVVWIHDRAAEPSLFSCAALTPVETRTMQALTPSLRENFRLACAYLDLERWALPYRALWRWHYGESCAVLAGDPDGSALLRRARAVARAAHLMKGFIRFRERPSAEGNPRFVASYTPEHDVLTFVAEHFLDRMGHTTWLISTPSGSVCSDGRQLIWGDAVSIRASGGDTNEDLWRRYYRSTFNPERLNPDLMRSHLPHRHEVSLPESRDIPALISAASLGESRQLHSSCAGIDPARPAEKRGRHTSRARNSDEALDACRQCELWENATYPVAGTGPSDARIVLVGEQADDHDDLVGEAFSGPSGRFLDTLLNDAGLSRETVYLTHAVKHFHFETKQLQRVYRSPSLVHIEACKGWLQQELEALAPRVVLALGRSAATALGHTGDALPHDAEPHALKGPGYWIVPTWHPDFALRSPDLAARTRAKAHITASLVLARQLADPSYCSPA